MARFIRFVVHQRIGGESRRLGPFAAAYFLRDDDDLFPHDRQRLYELLAWFEAELPVPRRGTIPASAVFWYADVGRFSLRMWELVQLLTEYDFTTELITARFVGRIVYRDVHQVAAVPPRRGNRGV
jgi:hypothetical protein